MKFSICIPNFNYARFLGETVDTALNQRYADVEVHVADNHSTDDSLAVLEAIDDPRLTFDRNRRNVGFAPNLDRAAAGTTGDWMIMLSSDDVIRPDAIQIYHDIIQQCGGPGVRMVVSSTCEVINPVGDPVGLMGPAQWCWRPADLDPELTRSVGVDVYRLPSEEVLRRSIATMRNPVWFASTCYPRALYEEVEGYSGQALVNPDKEFHWRVIAAAESVVFVDSPLFGYRVHPSNQDGQQLRTGAMKRIVDQYVATFNTDAAVLERAGATHQDLARNFVREDVAKRAVLSLIEEDLPSAQRIISFGRATYPGLMRTDGLALAARALVAARWVTAPVLARIGPWAFQRQLAQKMVFRRALADDRS